MNTVVYSAAKVCGAAALVIVPLVAAAWLPLAFPPMLRQTLLFGWGVGATLLIERWLFSATLSAVLHAVGFRPVRMPTLVIASLVSLPMWSFLPLLAWVNGLTVDLRPDWLSLLAGVALVNGITEEVIHRGFVFGHLRVGRSFVTAATISAALFAAQHLYLIVTAGWTIGLASVLLAALLAYPMAFVFERGGNSIVGPMILHTSSNAPVVVFALTNNTVGTPLLMHMAVTVVSMYLVFAAGKWVSERSM